MQPGTRTLSCSCIGCRRDLCIRMWHLNLINVQRRDGKWILRRILNYAPHVNRSVARNQPIPFCRATGARELQLQLPLQLQLRPQVALKGTVQLAGQWIACKVEWRPLAAQNRAHRGARQMLTNVGKGWLKYLPGLLLFSSVGVWEISESAFVSWMDCRADWIVIVTA